MAHANSQQRAAVLAALERVEREHARLGDALVAVSRESERKRSLLGDAKSALHAQEERLKAATVHCQAAAQQERQAKQLLQQEMDVRRRVASYVLLVKSTFCIFSRRSPTHTHTHTPDMNTIRRQASTSQLALWTFPANRLSTASFVTRRTVAFSQV